MANYFLCSCIFRVALPILISLCVLFRPSALSALYLLLLFILPLIPIPTSTTINGSTGIYLKILIVLSILTTLGQVAFQIVLFALPPYAHFIHSCDILEKILRHVGFIRLNELKTIDLIQWIAPEVIMLLSSITVFFLCQKLSVGRTIETTAEDGSANLLMKKSKSNIKYFSVFVSIGRYLVLIALCFASVLRPSIQGGLYFLIFLGSATWWACYKQLQKGFAILMRCLMVVVFFHICCLYAYQFQWPQELLDRNSTYARYFALTPILSVDCQKDPRIFVWSIEEWTVYVNPIALFLLYYILALESKALLQPQSQKKQGAFSRLEGSFTTGNLRRQMSQRLTNRNLMRTATMKRRWQNATRKVRASAKQTKQIAGEATPLIRGVSPSKRYGSGKKSGSVTQDSTGSVTVSGENPDDIPMEQFGKGILEEEYKATLFEKIMYTLEEFLQVIIKSSYIGTNIIMMTWSITYLSWLTFVLLLWANILWLVPNQRKSMLRSSPFLVLYAWFLLISAYIYSMDLTEEELPSTIQGVNLSQIGFQKVTKLACNPLLIKCLYTVMFWITLRQFMQERLAERQSSALADMVAPLQVTVGTATGVNDEQDQSRSKIMENIGNFLKKFATKFWIWVVAITLFGVAITGQRMTGFRILYMALFLIFILSFQLSFNIWRKMMFGFWLTVIVYSMINLVMVYTYQFDNFPEYWKDYLHVPYKQQLDIGLERFETKQLFVRLVTPTFFVVITVIQLHYFHKDFMALSDPKNANVMTIDLDESSLQGGAVPTNSNSEKDEPTTSSSVKFDLTDIGNISTLQIQKKWAKHIYHAVNLVFLFLELHMPKIILFFAMLLCVYDKCAIYIVLVVFIILGLTCGRAIQIFAIYASSVFVSIFLLARMIYQIQYIMPENWNVTCEHGNSTEIENNAQWLGFYKSEEHGSVPYLVRWNIIFIITVTLWSVILLRQFYYKMSKNQATTRAFFMFPKITRTEADKNLKNCIKYLFNYGFYKFGVELSLMATVALIGFRMDLYALIYSIWLCILFSLNRSTQAKIWNIYMAFIAILIPIQYFMTVGLPPTLCILFPWDKYFWIVSEWDKVDIYRRLQEWAYLLDVDYPPSPKKLLCDFFLLLFVARQAVVFRIEKRYQEQEYSGGSNESIIHHAEEKNFVNPVPDFITYCRSYLDVFKRAILLSFLWITLAIVFLAGTNRVTVFSIGYLIGAFVFLWQGTDLYLKPIPRILKSWNLFLGYNVAVILIKTALQIVGCIFMQDLPKYTCWAIQLFGIGCVKKFGNVAKQAGLEDSDECKVPREFVGLVWDGMCFGFLILQRRIFESYNFFHMIDETKATTILASRGAELIEELRLKRVNDQEEQEKRVLEKIKMKMDRIKANQQKIQGASYKDSTNHYVDKPPLARSSSMSSCTSALSQPTSPAAGYHTPIEDDDYYDQNMPQSPATRSSLNQQSQPAPSSPYSAIMPTSLDAYLEPQQMSFSSPSNSELNPRPPSPDESFPVFSPPPYAEAVSELPNSTTTTQRQSNIGPPWMQGSYVTPRHSIISYSSRSPLSHHEYTIFKGRPKYQRKTPKTYKQAVRSGDYYMFDDLDEDEIDFIEDVEEPEEDSKQKGLTVGQLLSTALKTNISETVRQTSYKEMDRRLSMPLTRQKSIISTRSQLSAPISAPPTTSEHISRSVTYADEQEPKEIVPRPGTSKQDDEISEISQPGTSWCQKILNYILFVWAFIKSVMISITNFLNSYSKDYRYVIKVLIKEKKILKETTDYNIGLRLGSGKVWQPAMSYHDLLRQSREEPTIPTPSVTSPSDSYKQVLLDDGRMDLVTQTESVEKSRPHSSEESDTKAVATPLPSDHERRKASILTVPEIRILAPSLERGLDTTFPLSENSSQMNALEEYECTEMSSYDQPTIIRLLLAIWFIIMSRSEVVCYFIIFLNQIKSATFLSLPLPLMVFLWGTLTVPRPAKTFWVTIIAYTEVIVLIKCMFQFDIIPWNQSSQGVINNNSPFYPPRIIGIERNKDYAVWDLLLLLVVFFHRFMLKSMGLWRTSAVPAAILVDGDYKIGPGGTLIPIGTISPSKRKSGKNIGKKKDSTEDLQKLVQETDEDNVEERKFSVLSEEELTDKIVSVKTEIVDPGDHIPHSIRMATSKYMETFKVFFQQLLDPTSRIATDVYSYMFLCDFFNFFVILIGYSAFGTQQGDGGVRSYLEDNRVPVLFLVMLILQFMLIIIDRGIYLRKNILAKIIFQFIQVFILHLWLFVLFPIITERSCNSVLPPQMYYIVKCFYLLLSAYQLRCGYPTRILGNFLCKGYTYLNMFLFRGFMTIPFLYELRTVMDWMWTDTSMTVFDWIKMEDIFAHIFILKCSRHVEDEYPQARGERKSPLIKYIMGSGILLIIIAVIWFPLVFFSLGNAVGEANPPYDVTLEIRIGPYEPVYQISAQSNSIYTFTENDIERLMKVYSMDKMALSFISNYEATDISAVKLSSDSAKIWGISPPDRQRMVDEVNSTSPLMVRLEYKVSHKTSKPEDSGVIPDNVIQVIPANTTKYPNKIRENLLEMLQGNISAKPVLLQNLMPKFLKITNRGTAKPITQLMEPLNENDELSTSLRNISLNLLRTNTTQNFQEWWEIIEKCDDENYVKYLKDLPYSNCDSIILYTFNDKIFPATLNIITTGGILGLYTTLVFLASRILRGFFAEQCFKIMFEDLPYVDRVLQLCHDIYLVRESREFTLEEDLFAKLVFLFRSPETLIKWTRPKEELDDEEDPEGA